MRFYHCFYTDLPDQFVEANSNRLIKSLDWLYPDETMMGIEQETLNRLRQKYGVGK